MNYLYESTFRKGRAKNYNNLNLLIVLICLHLLLMSIASLKCGKVCNLAPPFPKGTGVAKGGIKVYSKNSIHLAFR